MEFLSRARSIQRSLWQSISSRARRAGALPYATSAIVLILLLFLFAPPAHFQNTSLVIREGTSAADVAQILAEHDVIAEPLALRVLLRIFGRDNAIQAGAYRFSRPEGVVTIAVRLVTGTFGYRQVKITVPEGETVRDIASRVAKAFPDISADNFLASAESNEGYLYPDTYFISASSTPDSIIETMRDNFDTQTGTLQSAALISGHSFLDILTMASLVEREARDETDRRIVAGILWNRIKRDMPLQVDAVFGYIKGRDTYSPSLADLKIDSPYNTYTHRGLPPGPICNPGIDAIDAALHPTDTEYLYYLTGTDGKMHYATTFAEHQANRKKYLP